MNCPNCNYEDGNDEKSFGNITLDGPLTIANFYDCPRCGVLFFDRSYVPDKPNIDVKKKIEHPGHGTFKIEKGFLVELKFNELNNLLEYEIRQSLNHNPPKEMPHDVLCGFLEGLRHALAVITQAELQLVEYRQLQERMTKLPMLGLGPDINTNKICNCSVHSKFESAEHADNCPLFNGVLFGGVLPPEEK